MNSSDFITLSLLAITFIGGVVTGASGMNKQNRENLIKSGHALYYLDKDNERAWRLLTPEEMRDTPKVILNGTAK
jgi:hypothetical protein